MLELFTLVINKNGNVDLQFNGELLQVIGEEELINSLSLEQQEQIIKIACSIADTVKGVE